MCHDNLNTRQWSRRAFLKGGSMAVFGLTLGGLPPFVVNAANSKHKELIFSKKKTLITIFQRGAMDGLAAVQPINNPFLKANRPRLFIDNDSKDEKLLRLDDEFGLSPYLKPFKSIYDNGQMAIIHGSGIPIENRSHFDMQDFAESGTPGKKSTLDGWLNRAMENTKTTNNQSPFRAVALTPTKPRIFYGNESSLSVERLEDLNFPETLLSEEQLNGIGKEYEQERNERLSNSGKNGIEAVKLLKRIDFDTKSEINYPKSNLGNSLKQIAQLIKAGVGLEIAFAESTGWDTHSRQPTRNGAFARNATDLSNSIAAFWNDIEKFQDDVVVMTMTEFGRTTKENGSLGTDHGRGSCQFLIGNNLKSKTIFNNLKSIDEETSARELPVTTDFRDVCATVLAKHLNIEGSSIFPNYNVNYLDLFRA